MEDKKIRSERFSERFRGREFFQSNDCVDGPYFNFFNFTHDFQFY
jgi:hypothetical protein